MPRRGSARTTTRRDSSTASSGPFDQWPSGMGFQYFYGFMGGETDQWTPYLFRDHTQIFPWIGRERLQPHHRHGGRGHQSHAGASMRRRPSSRSSCTTFPAAATRRTSRRRSGSTSSRASSTWAGRSMREQIFANQKRLGVIPRECEAHALAGWPAEMGLAVDPAKEALCTAGRSVCRLYRLHRLRDRPRDPVGRGHGQARRHADHLHRRRQRDQPGRHALRHVQSVHGLQRHP